MAGDISISSLGGGAISGFRNVIINGNFGINQRAVSGTVTLSAGVYGHDRWKAGASGCTYTFATTNNVTTITITAGTLVQVIEGLSLQSGTYTLTWQGSAQARIDSGSYSVSGMQGTAVGGTNQTVEFSTGTVSKVQYEQGTTYTVFENRPYGLEFSLCQRYYQTMLVLQDVHGGSLNVASTYLPVSYFPIQPMRTTPTVTATSATNNFGGTLTHGASTASVIFFYGNRSGAGWNSGSNTCSETALLSAEL